MRCDSCGQEEIHFNFGAEFLKDGQWHTGTVCWECQKRFAPAIREKNRQPKTPQPAPAQLAAGGHFLLPGEVSR
jgi:hypothetical protein